MGNCIPLISSGMRLNMRFNCADFLLNSRNASSFLVVLNSDAEKMSRV